MFACWGRGLIININWVDISMVWPFLIGTPLMEPCDVIFPKAAHRGENCYDAAKSELMLTDQEIGRFHAAASLNGQLFRSKDQPADWFQFGVSGEKFDLTVAILKNGPNFKIYWEQGESSPSCGDPLTLQLAGGPGGPLCSGWKRQIHRVSLKWCFFRFTGKLFENTQIATCFRNQLLNWKSVALVGREREEQC